MSIPIDARQFPDSMYWVNMKGHVYSEKSCKFLKENLNRVGGYACVKLYFGGNYKDAQLFFGGNHKDYANHKLVAMLFPELICNHELHEKFPNVYRKLDHIDGNKLNNSVDNLRWCDDNQNMYNRPVNYNNRLGKKGISKTVHGTYQARVGAKGKRYYKTFKTIEEAEKYLINKRIALHAEFRHN
jgi:HNH endonuclease